MKQLRYATCVLTALAALGTPAFAVDGVTLINQATVQAAGGFPYVINQSGSYRLSGNLMAASAAAIIISAPNVTLDLNGFTVSCTSCTETVIYSAQAGTEILNGSVTGSSSVDCIDLAGSSRVDHVTISTCFNGIGGSTATASFTVMNSFISGATLKGIVGSHVSVVNTTIDGFGNFGIEGGVVVVSGSTILGSNVGSGVEIDTSGVVSGSSISGAVYGIYIGSTAAAASITNNTIFFNSYGVYAAGSGKTLVGSNAFAGNSVADLSGSSLLLSQKNNA